MTGELVRRHVAPEMLALSVVELVLTFSLALVLLTPSTSSFNFASVQFASVCALTVCFVAFTTGLYRPQMFGRAKNIVFSTLLSALLSFPAVWVVSKGLGLGEYWPVAYDSFRPVKIVTIWCLAVLGIRLIFLLAARFNLFVHRVGILGLVETPSVLAAINAGKKGFLEISALSPQMVTLPNLATRGIRTLVIAREASTTVKASVLRELSHKGVRVQPEAEFWERYLRRVDIDVTVNDLKLHDFKEANGVSLFLVRAFDLVVSLGLLLATLPIIGVVALVIRLDSSGTVLYRQERVGLNSSSFTLLKFRSMKSDAELSGPRWAQQKDPRVTRIGLFMRRTRIDELPQLLNIFRGEMSFIGPRPERPHFVEQLIKIIPHYENRSRVKPGLTGWAQVNYPYGASVEDARAKLSYDLYYVKNRTLLLDLLILLSTIRVILLQEGAR